MPSPARTLCAVFAFLLLLAGAPGPASAGKPVCGDGKAQGGAEQCDGADLRGATCTSLGYPGGTLACDSSCTYDVSGCSVPPPEPSCGDGVVEGFEECDGAADAACPSACSDHCACPGGPVGGSMELHFIDVGQGDSALIVSPDGFVMLVDGGIESQASTVAAYLAAVGITDLDYILVSHMHADHIGSLDLVLADHPETVACFDHGAAFSTNEFDEYALAAGARRTEVGPGAVLDLGAAVTVDVLHADQGDTSNENLNSVVFRVNHGSLSFLLGGDCEGPCEALYNPGPIEVYKVHHHGASDSSTADFLAQMDPYTAVISAGAGNSFGHPHTDTLDRLAAAQADVWRTDLAGDVVLVSDGSTYTVNGAPVCVGGETRSCGVTDVGACSFGTRACDAGMWSDACVGEVTPVTEDCANGLDDDCDGLTDGADPDCAAPAGGLVLSQVAYDTPGTDSLEEFVDLYNPTGSSVSLDGWSLADAGGSWGFPTGASVAPGEYLSVARDAAGFAALYGLDPDVAGLTLSLANAGDALSLVAPGGAEADYVAWEGYAPGWSLTANIGDSIERFDPTGDTDTEADWGITSPASPRGGAITTSSCGDGVCDPGEDCISCASDCIGKTNGPPSGRFCCGNGACEGGEDAGTCAIDCAP